MRRPLRTRLARLFLALTTSAAAFGAIPAGGGKPPSPLFELLGLWSSADGGNLTAVPRLMNLVEARTADREGGSSRLARDARRLRRLLADSPAAYTPVIDLYTRAYVLAVRSRKTRTATHLEIETIRLIDESMAVRLDEEGARLGSLFMTRLALTSRDGRDLDSARRLFERALDIDPFNEVALHAAAAIQEKLGNYAEAADLLQRLLLLDDLADAELRLALCLERMGRSKTAERRLEQLARGNADDWIRSLAYQEWSQIRSSHDDTDEALALAREGLAALPDDDSLAILVAYLSGSRDHLSSAIVLRLTSGPTGEGPTARGVYNLWPTGLRAIDSAIEKEVEVAIPALRAALAEEYGSDPTSAARPSQERSLR